MAITNDPDPSRPRPPSPAELDDPVYRHTRREALLILGLWITAMVYTLTVCYVWGYGRDPATLTHVWGIPDWVFYGIFVPWAVCDLVTIFYCFFFAAEDDLSSRHEEGFALPPEAHDEH